MVVHFLTDNAGNPATVLCGMPMYPREVNHPRLKNQLEWTRHKDRVTCKYCLRRLEEQFHNEILEETKGLVAIADGIAKRYIENTDRIMEKMRKTGFIT